MVTSDMSFTNNQFKTYRSFKWTNNAEVESANLDTFLKEEFIEMTFNFEVKFIYILDIGHWILLDEPKKKKKNKLCVTIEAILFTFPSLYMVKSGFSHVHYLLSKQRSILNIECGDLRLKTPT